MSEDSTIQVNFGKPMPLFPLDTVTLLPQQVVPLHIFEPRYRQMVERALDSSGQIAMAVFAGSSWKQQYHGRPSLRSAVCIGQIVQHEHLPDGRFNLLVQGICRARIIRELPPADDRLFRTALLEPLGVEQHDAPELPTIRTQIEHMLSKGELSNMTAAAHVLEWIGNDDIPSSMLLELVTFALIVEPSVRYRLLSEGDVSIRAGVIIEELEHLERMIHLARRQRPQDWPKGMSWN